MRAANAKEQGAEFLWLPLQTSPRRVSRRVKLSLY